jgi:hypothetical protein
MAANDIFVDELSDGLGISVFNGLGLNPFGKVVYGDNDVSLSRRGVW